MNIKSSIGYVVVFLGTIFIANILFLNGFKVAEFGDSQRTIAQQSAQQKSDENIENLHVYGETD